MSTSLEEWFDGPAYIHELDSARLSSQHARIRDLMLDGKWRTLDEIAVATNYPQASISAQLRHLRKKRFGSYVVERRREHGGLFYYRVIKPETGVLAT